uniref:Dolichyl-P-Glc:Glc(2)Man(9)GlcNAc(2)-PP-dolichol alpha-1,2-glucosyltransferase n=1 Tax=Caenorhabditis tropicalis TaxID=1561998 RepID=A0A1I7TY08_9PELO
MKSTFIVFYSTNIVFNYLLGFLDSPYILLPALAGSPLGMMRYFSIPPNVQVYFLVASLACKFQFLVGNEAHGRGNLLIFPAVIISMPILFERWFHEMITKQSRAWNKWRLWWIFAHYLVVVVLVLIGIIETPEQNEINRAKVVTVSPANSSVT